MEYDTLTDQINNKITSGISKGTDWNAIPGGLDKVSESAKGFLWGLGSGNVWICQSPCQGNWKQVKLSSESSIRDIVTDDAHIYVLLQNQLSMKSSDNTDEWIYVNLPDDIEKIISTSSYIWGQAGDKKYKLPKPGMTGNWIPVKDDLNIKITSASSGHLYGINSDGKAMITDEAMQTSWSIIPEFGGKYTAIFGDADQTALFGIDSTNSLNRCLNGKCHGVDTKGYTPQSITIEPSSKQMWMTTTTPGKSGNIFNLPISSDYTDILKSIRPIDEKRDESAKKVEAQFEQSTYSGMMTRQFDYLKKMLGDIFAIKPAASHEEDQQKIKDEIDNTDNEVNVLKDVMPLIQKILIVLASIIGVYVFSDIFGSMTHLVALAVMVGGTYYFAVNK
jgi:hypothetical protein